MPHIVEKASFCAVQLAVGKAATGSFLWGASRYVRNCWCGVLVAPGALFSGCVQGILLIILGVERDGLAVPLKSSGVTMVSIKKGRMQSQTSKLSCEGGIRSCLAGRDRIRGGTGRRGSE